MPWLSPPPVPGCRAERDDEAAAGATALTGGAGAIVVTGARADRGETVVVAVTIARGAVLVDAEL